MPRRANRIVIELDADSRRAQRELRRAEWQVRRFTRNISQQAGRIGLAFGGAGVAAGALAAQYETQFARIEGLVGVTRGEIDKLKESTLALAEDTGRGPRELADALFLATSAGFRGAEALRITELAGKAAAAGLGDAASVTDALTAAIGAYGSESLTAAQAGDVLARTVEQGRLDAAGLSGVIGPLSGLAASLGVEFHELGAGIAALSRVTDTSGAATQLRGILTGLIRPSAEASKALEAAGISADVLRQAVADRGLLPALEHLVAAGVPLESVFSDTQALAGALQLTGAQADANRKIFAALGTSTGKLDDAYQAVAETTEFQLRKELVQLEAEATRLGTTALPLATDALGVMSSVAQRTAVAVNELPPAVQTVIAAVGATGLAGLLLGPRITGGIRQLRTLRSSLQAIATTGTGARAALAGVGASLAGPAGIALAASVAAIAVGWAAVADNVRKAREATERLNEATAAADPGRQAIESIRERIRTASGDDTISPGVEALLPLFGTRRRTATDQQQRLDQSLRQALATLLPQNIPAGLLPDALAAATAAATRPGIAQIGRDVITDRGRQLAELQLSDPRIARGAGRADIQGLREGLDVFAALAERLSEAGHNGAELVKQIIEIGEAAQESAAASEAQARETLLANDVQSALVKEFGETYVAALLRQAEVTNDYAGAAAILDERMRGAEASTSAASEAIEGLGTGIDADTLASQDLLADAELNLASAANIATEAVTATALALQGLADPIGAGFGRPGAEVNLRQGLGRLETAVNQGEITEIPALLESALTQAATLLEAVPDQTQRQNIYFALRGRVRDAAATAGYTPDEISTITALLGTPAFPFEEGEQLSRFQSRQIEDYPLPPIFEAAISSAAEPIRDRAVNTAAPINYQTFVVEAGADVIARSQELDDLSRDEGRARP